MGLEKIHLKQTRLRFIRNAIAVFFIITVFINSLSFGFSKADTSDYTFKWSVDYGFESFASPVAEDINGDGIYEIFIAGRYSSGTKSGIVCINGSNGKILWSKNFTSLIEWHIPCAIGDLDNNGDLEIVHAAGTRTIARNCEDGSELWNVPQDSGWGTPAIADLDDNNQPYVIVASNTAFEGTPKVRKLIGSTGALAASETIHYCCYGGISIADLDRDGEFEIIASDSSYGGGSNVMDENLNTLWQTGSYTQESHCAVLADVVGDEDLEVIKLKQSASSTENGGIYIYYANGDLVPGKSSSDLDLTTHCQPTVYDVDKDGRLELITAYGGNAKVWDLTTWSLDATLEIGEEPANCENVIGDEDLEVVSPSAWVDCSVDIYDSSYANIDEIGSCSPGNHVYGINTITQDIDNDGLNEIIVTGSAGLAGQMIVYDTTATAAIPSVRTDTSYYSERRTAAAIYVPKIGGKCVISSVNPSNGATGISVSTSTLSVYISEPDGDSIDWSIETSPDAGTSSGINQNNGTKTCGISGLNYDTMYTWYVNVTDGTNWEREQFTFMIEGSNSGMDETDFFVNGGTGNDGNNGSFDFPWKTIQHAMDVLNPGDTVYIMEGVYYDYGTPWSGVNSGTPDKWITYTNYPGDTVVIDGTGGTSDWAGLIWFDGQSYIKISGLTFRNSCSHGILIEDTGGGSGSSHHIIIDNCTIYNCSESAINIKGTLGVITDVVVENNVIYDTQNGWNDIGEPGDESITFSNCHGFEIRDNIMFDNHKINIDAKAGCMDGSIHHNRIDTTSWWVSQYGTLGIYVDGQNRYCENISIYNNVVWGNGTGFTASTENGGTLTNINLFNNIYNGTRNGFQINDHTQQAGSHLKTDLRFINNVCGENTDICFQITDRDSSFGNLTIRNNILAGNTGINLGGDLNLNNHNVDHNLFDVGNSMFYGTDYKIGDPEFVNSASGDYSLLQNSPGIDNGSSLSAPEFDFNDNFRPQGLGIDIGAFELQIGDSMPPQIEGVSIGSSIPQDTSQEFGWENISCTITDVSALSVVWVKIIHPNGTQDVYDMIKSDGIQYYFNSSLSTLGHYNFQIIAKDIHDNQNNSIFYDYSLPPNWDINGDGECNVLDLVLVSNHYDEDGVNGWIREDVDNSGSVEVLDLALISQYCGQTW